LGEDFSVLAYPPETVFAEKLNIVFKKGGKNTRMKDYYDLLQLTAQSLNPQEAPNKIVDE
jgi:predicted nucleotidyltransferase component of viral defense system